jgi:two-component system sensor histidine kinase HydH
MGQMAATVAHSIRNPLASISTSAEIAMELTSSPEVQEIAEDITIEVKRVDQWIREFLLFSHPREIGLERIIELHVLLVDVLTEYARTFEKKGINYDLSKAQSSLLIYGDITLLKQMLNSLISNAIEAMPDGGRIICRIKRAANNTIKISIFDNGKGIDRKLISSIFKPFFTSKQNGVGIGLTQVKRIIDDHSGSITIRSKKNYGTVVTLLFPAISSKKPSVLVIEDELKLASNIQTYLQKFKYDVPKNKVLWHYSLNKINL